jgi:hypothetical protein
MDVILLETLKAKQALEAELETYHQVEKGVSAFAGLLLSARERKASTQRDLASVNTWLRKRTNVQKD